MSELSRPSVALRMPFDRGSPSLGAKSIRQAEVVGGTRVAVALVRASLRELTWGMRLVAREIEDWRAQAAQIPDTRLRADALGALQRKRGNINGAALFWTLPDRREHNLLKTLVAYEVLADYLDCVNERGAELGIANGRQLHLALLEALDPDKPMSDYYRYHYSDDDGGYARLLVESCRKHCAMLNGYETARPFLTRAAGLSAVLAINHEPDPTRRVQGLLDWDLARLAEEGGEPASHGQREWYERTAGASAWLTVLAMLALAAEPGRSSEDAARTYAVYLDWIAPAGAMLDSYSDIAEDAANEDHSYLAHYPSIEVAIERLTEMVRGSRRATRVLPVGARHSLLGACMIAFYLSKDSVRTPGLRDSTRDLRRAGGPLVAVLLPVLRTWRTINGQRST